jgi:hypothetical protein
MTMKSQRFNFWLAGIVGLWVALLLWHWMSKPATAPLTVPVETNANQAASNAARPDVPAADTGTPAADAAASPNAPTPHIEGKAESAIGILSTYNDVPIDFYGKLEDQFGRPVAGAVIKGSIMVINGARAGSDLLSTTSDGEGLFQFHGKGENIGMMPLKAGYALASTETLYKYSRLETHPYTSDPANPTIIKMWRLQGAEPLLLIDQHYKIHYTDAPIAFDLLTGNIVPGGGDVKITVTRPPGVISGRNPRDWSFGIEAVDGGLAESDGQEAVTYAAPDSGYQPSAIFSMSVSNNTWYEGLHKGFFLTSRGGQVYAKLGISFRINRMPDDFMYITFGGVANTNGSRNWESDPNTMKPN